MSPIPEAPERVRRILLDGAAVKTRLAEEGASAVARAAGIVTDCLRRGGKVLLFGNGGSASDAQHIAAELTGRLSGNSPNVLAAVAAARERGLLTIGLVGRGGGKLAPLVDCAVVVPSDDTQRIQESHIAVGHALCELVDEALFPEGPTGSPGAA